MSGQRHKPILAVLVGMILTLSATQALAADTLTVVLGGDLMLDRGVRPLLEKVGVAALLADVSPVWQDADAVLVNLEGPVLDSANADPVNKEITFRFDPMWLSGLRQAGITHLGLTNNHTLDHGSHGFDLTTHHIQEAGLVPVGNPVSSERALTTVDEPTLLTSGVVTVAVFATDLVDHPEGAEDLLTRVRDFSERRPATPMIAFLHWGIEYHSEPDSAQINLAHRLIDAGVDAVLGHHPHVVQTVDTYRDRPIVYTLGNLLFDQDLPWTAEGWLAELRFTSGSERPEMRVHTFDRVAVAPVTRNLSSPAD